MSHSHTNSLEINTCIALSASQYDQINTLWNENYPVELKDRFPILISENKNLSHYIIYENQNLIAWAVIFKTDSETRFSIIVDKQQQGKGIGNLILNQLKLNHSPFYGWVINHNESLLSSGENYLSPLPFYLKNGFELLSDRIDNEMIRAVKIKFEKQINLIKGNRRDF